MPDAMNSPPRQQSRRLMAALLALASLVVLAAVIYLVSNWPFSRASVIKELEDESFSKVSASAFHQTYFPHPGCVLERVAFQHNPKAGAPPLITIENMRIEGSYAALFRRHISRVVVEGMHILVPPKASGERFETPQRTTVVIDDLVADGATLEVLRQDDKPPLRF